MLRLVDCRQIFNLISDLVIDHFAVGRLNKTVAIGTSIGRQRVYQTDVWPFWRLNRAHASVVSRMHVADFKACSFAGQSAWPQC